MLLAQDRVQRQGPPGTGRHLVALALRVHGLRPFHCALLRRRAGALLSERLDTRGTKQILSRPDARGPDSALRRATVRKSNKNETNATADFEIGEGGITDPVLHATCS